MKELPTALLLSTIFAGAAGAQAPVQEPPHLTSSTMSIQKDAQGHQMFVYTCVYSNGVVLQNQSSCPKTI
jgi:hypothetical protein